MSVFTEQCLYCAFKLTEDQSTVARALLVEDKYRAIRGVKGSPLKRRTISVGGSDDKTETCFIDSPVWEKKNEDIYCPDRLDNSLPLESALALRESRISNRFARDAKIWAIIAAIIAIIAIAVPYVI